MQVIKLQRRPSKYSDMLVDILILLNYTFLSINCTNPYGQLLLWKH